MISTAYRLTARLLRDATLPVPVQDPLEADRQVQNRVFFEVPA